MERCLKEEPTLISSYCKFDPSLDQPWTRLVVCSLESSDAPVSQILRHPFPDSQSTDLSEETSPCSERSVDDGSNPVEQLDRLNICDTFRSKASSRSDGSAGSLTSSVTSCGSNRYSDGSAESVSTFESQDSIRSDFCPSGIAASVRRPLALRFVVRPPPVTRTFTKWSVYSPTSSGDGYFERF